MKKTAALTGILILIATFSFASETPRFVIDSGHSGAVSVLDYSESEKLIFSAGFDGAVKIWDIDSAELVYQMHISHMPIRRMSVCETNPYLAVVESDGINAFNLSVWNWKSGDMIFRQTLKEIPLFIKFSPKGTFLVYGKTDWNSLIFLDIKTGNQLPYITEGFGIVSAAFISSSEKTLLTYGPSGNIQYWDLPTGTQKQRISTVAGLENISFFSSGRYMTGTSGRNILLIDLISGATTASIPAGELSASAIDRKKDTLIYITKSGQDIIYNSVSAGRDGFGEAEKTTARNILPPSDLVSVNGTVISAHNSGELYIKKPSSGRTELFSGSRLLKINDFAVSEDSMAVTSPGKILTISTDFFINGIKGGLVPEVASNTYTTDEKSTFGISAGAGEEFLVWPMESVTGGEIRKFTDSSGFDGKLTQILAPLLSAEYRDGKVLTLNKNGDCRIIDYENGKEDFRYSSFGLRVIGFIDDSTIIAGRNSSSTLATPLLQINTRTGETVPIRDSNLLTFALSYDELSRKLYTLGFEQRDGKMRTILKEHTGRNHDRAETIMTFPGEDIEADFAVDRNSSKIFTTLGYSGVKMLYWGGFTPLQRSFSIPRALKLSGSILSGLNRDGSFTIWNSRNGTKIMDLYIFKDLSWIALLSDDKCYISPGAEKYIHIYAGDTSKKLRQNNYSIKTAVR